MITSDLGKQVVQRYPKLHPTTKDFLIHQEDYFRQLEEHFTGDEKLYNTFKKASASRAIVIYRDTTLAVMEQLLPTLPEKDLIHTEVAREGVVDELQFLEWNVATFVAKAKQYIF